MREKLIQYVDLLFAGAPNCQDIKQEILQNTLDRYDDLIDQGKVPEAAYRLAISGLGENAAKDIVAGREGKDFLSIEEFSVACPKVSKTHIQMLKDAGAFGDLPETSQVSLF